MELRYRSDLVNLLKFAKVGHYEGANLGYYCALKMKIKKQETLRLIIKGNISGQY